MAANSKHYADVAEWLYKVIDSCVTVTQALSAKRLVRLYTKIYPSEGLFDPMEITHLSLLDWCDMKINSLIYKK
jgi:hypothetical protein